MVHCDCCLFWTLEIFLLISIVLLSDELFDVVAAFEDLSSNPGRCIMLMDALLAKSSIDLLPYRNVLVASLPRLLDENVPRHCQDLVVRIWNKMNGIFPSRHVNTINNWCSNLKPSVFFMNGWLLQKYWHSLHCYLFVQYS